MNYKEKYQQWLTFDEDTKAELAAITDEKDVAIIISDRYKLSKFKINKEDINVDNIDEINTSIANMLSKLNIFSKIKFKKDKNEKDTIRRYVLFDGMHVMHRATRKRRLCD